MITRILTVTLTIMLAGITVQAARFEIVSPLCTVTGKVVAPPSQPILAKGPAQADTVIVGIPVPVPACTVWALTPISSRQFFGITDNAGLYKIDSVPVLSGFDSITIVARKTGYVETSQIVHLSANGTVTADITLPKSPVNVRITGPGKSPEGKTRFFGRDRSRIRSVSIFSIDGRISGWSAGTGSAAGAYHAVLCRSPLKSGVMIIRIAGDGMYETEVVNLQTSR